MDVVISCKHRCGDISNEAPVVLVVVEIKAKGELSVVELLAYGVDIAAFVEESAVCVEGVEGELGESI